MQRRTWPKSPSDDAPRAERSNLLREIEGNETYNGQQEFLTVAARLAREAAFRALFMFRRKLETLLGKWDRANVNQLFFLASFWAIRALTIFFKREMGRGLSAGKRMVPLERS